MTSPIFSTSAQLQDFLLKEAGPGTLVVVPHQRLAHQVWQRQRAAALAGCRPAWEPVPLVTLQAWMCDLFQSLWPEEALAPPLTRLALWRRALRAGPPLAGAAPDLEWAENLDEAYETLCRHLLAPAGQGTPADSPLVAWRRQVSAIYARLLREGAWLTPGELPAYLLRALEGGAIALPTRVLVAGLETPAPGEEAFLTALARLTQVLRPRVSGDPQVVKRAVVLPEAGQEMEWAATQVLAWFREGLALHRLALTAPDLDHYAPQLRRVLGELLGPFQGEEGWAYNFSKGETLAQTSLFQAALLPLKFRAGGESREDLVSLLLSPYYREFQRYQGHLPRWDRLFRQHRVDRGWEALKEVAAREEEAGGPAPEVLPLLERAWVPLAAAAASGREWVGYLASAWQTLGFPQGLEAAEAEQWQALEELLGELEGALASESLTLGEFLEWLGNGGRARLLPGPGVQDAGLQVLGLLEMRGLDFSRVLCLGMNAGVFPQPPRPLPLFNAAEKKAVLGGTYESQHRFARGLYETCLGTAPAVILTRPRMVDKEEQVASPFYLGPWEAEHLELLSVPHGAWLRVPQVLAAFQAPAATGPVYSHAPVAMPPIRQLSLSKLTVGLRCPCRFFLEVLLTLEELPEIASGLDPRERGDRLHKTLARFAADFQKILAQGQGWPPHQARERLKAAARQILSDLKGDLHWEAEWERWLGESQGFLWEWLRLEKDRFEAGWRWQGIEAAFDGLAGEGWGFTVKGRIDRMDHHPEEDILGLWDYKTGEVAKPKEVFETGEEVQLPGYLLAVRRGRVAAPTAGSLQAGFIGLKSAREKHLKYEDFPKHQERWPEVLAAWEARVRLLSQVMAAGDFRPRPTSEKACLYCSYQLICGFIPEPGAEAEEEEGGGAEG
jgi:RecB family exonuclease